MTDETPAGQFKSLDRKRLRFFPLSDRKNRVSLEEGPVFPDKTADPFSNDETAAAVVRQAASDINKARKNGKPVILAFGAHTIKNGLAPVLIAFMRNGWVTHLATNGAGIIHDWELSYLGKTSEHVRENAALGKFGMWHETGYTINLAIAAGSFYGMGYGESVGSFIAQEGTEIPEKTDVLRRVEGMLRTDPSWCASALDFIHTVEEADLKPGFFHVPHPHKEHSVQASAYELSIPCTAHPMFGHDIIYTHPLNSGAAVGRTAERDFLRFAGSVADMEGGVYLSVGSAVMSPMIFEKSFSMAQNLSGQKDGFIDNFSLYVIDLMASPWDWSTGKEPPEDNPAYYLRFCKSFSRMGGTMRYLQADNRDFFQALYNRLNNYSKGEDERSRHE